MDYKRDRTIREVDYKREYTVTGLGNCSTKEKQKEAIVHFINGNDCFVSLPTGYGKSMCYGILFLLHLEGRRDP